MYNISVYQDNYEGGESKMRISTLEKIVEKHFLNGRSLTPEEASLLALVADVQVHDKTKEAFAPVTADSLEDMVSARKAATKAYYLELASKYDE